jgi:oligopeptide transport system permease protein
MAVQERAVGQAQELEIKRPPVSLWRDAWNRLLKNRMAMVGLVFVLIVVLAAVLAAWVAPYHYKEADFKDIRKPPSAEHLMGTDKLGRDVFSRIIWGAQVSVTVAVVGSLTALVIGLTYGSISGYLGGRIDNYMMRFVDVMYAFPTILFIILIMVVLGPGLVNIFIGIGAVGWMSMARLVRGQFLSLKEKEFVEAARMIGASDIEIIARHLLPNSLGPIVVAITLNIPYLILLESVLSFIGLGVPPPFPSWGQMISEGWQGMRAVPHLTIFPGLAISISMLAFNFLGDGLRDALDPMMRGTS